MANMIDLSESRRFILPLKFRDEAGTVVLLTPPTEAWAELISARLPELTTKMTAGDKDAIEECYSFAAELINFNRSSLTVTVEELKGKYKFDQWDLLLFMASYVDFITTISNEKN